jgi:N-acyl-D-amino-acid deacylase
MSETILVNGLLYDGTGAPPYYGSIGISGDKIAWINRERSYSGEECIHLNGLAVAPGFIDGHTHAEGYVLNIENPFLGKFMQGVTTEILGNCGLSIFPIEPGHEHELRDYFGPFTGPYELKWDWSGFKSIEDGLDGKNLLANAGSLVGHGSLRIAAMGFEYRKPNPEELEKMISLLNTAFDEGAVGLSLGLMYPPGLFAETEELSALAKVAALRNRPVTSHMRNETFNLLDSVEEMIQVASMSGASIVISHHKAVGKQNWGKLTESLKMIDEARAKGMNIYIDVYPYTAGNTMLRALLPPWSLEGGIPRMIERLDDEINRADIRYWILERKDWENLSLAGGWDSIMILSTKTRHEYEGRYLDELAADTGKEPVDFTMDLLIEEEGEVVILLFTAWEEDLTAAMKKPYCMIASDGIPAAGRTHPRLYGSFPRFLSRYVLEKAMMPLEEGIRRITSFPAEVYGIRDRGVLHKGAYADIVVFDPAQLKDNATYEEPGQMPSGIHYVFLAGQMAVRQGVYEGTRFGKFVSHGN